MKRFSFLAVRLAVVALAALALLGGVKPARAQYSNWTSTIVYDDDHTSQGYGNSSDNAPQTYYYFGGSSTASNSFPCQLYIKAHILWTWTGGAGTRPPADGTCSLSWSSSISESGNNYMSHSSTSGGTSYWDDFYSATSSHSGNVTGTISNSSGTTLGGGPVCSVVSGYITVQAQGQPYRTGAYYDYWGWNVSINIQAGQSPPG